MDYFLDQNLVDFTSPIISMDLHAFQLIDKKLEVKINDNLINLLEFLVPSFNFVLLIFSGLMLYLASLALILSVKKRKNDLQTKILSFFCILVFFFFIEQFFNGNLNTANIVVNTG